MNKQYVITRSFEEYKNVYIFNSIEEIERFAQVEINIYNLAYFFKCLQKDFTQQSGFYCDNYVWTIKTI